MSYALSKISIFMPLDYNSCHLITFSGTSRTINATSTSKEVSASNLGAQGRIVLPVAVRRAAHLSDGVVIVARAEGEAADTVGALLLKRLGH